MCYSLRTYCVPGQKCWPHAPYLLHIPCLPGSLLSSPAVPPCLQPFPWSCVLTQGDFDPEGHLTMPGDILHCHTGAGAGDRCCWHKVGGGQGCYQHPTGHRTKNNPVLNVSRGKVRNPGLEATSKTLTQDITASVSPGTSQVTPPSRCSSATETTCSHLLSPCHSPSQSLPPACPIPSPSMSSQPSSPTDTHSSLKPQPLWAPLEGLPV